MVRISTTFRRMLFLLALSCVLVGGDASSSSQLEPLKNVLPRECSSQSSCVKPMDSISGKRSLKIHGNGGFDVCLVFNLVIWVNDKGLLVSRIEMRDNFDYLQMILSKSLTLSKESLVEVIQRYQLAALTRYLVGMLLEFKVRHCLYSAK